MKKIIPVILSGGQGMRLWPLSRGDRPKQFIPLIFGKSLFEQTLERVKDSKLFDNPIIICANQHRSLIKDILNQYGTVKKIIAEPMGRNTAPALCAAALYANSISAEDSLLLMVPSDHFIPDIQKFMDTVEQGVPLALENLIVTFGIQPHSANTEFGYIEKGDRHGNGFSVRKFHEKPDKETATKYLHHENNFLWNSGIFLVTAKNVIKMMEQFAPNILASVKETLYKSQEDLGDLILDTDSFSRVPDLSIDKAIMEKTKNSSVILAQFQWDDLGTWNALWTTGDKDKDGNVSQGDIISVNTCNSYLWTDGPLLCTVGLTDMIAVVLEDAVFVVPRDKSDDMRTLITALKKANRPELSRSKNLK